MRCKRYFSNEIGRYHPDMPRTLRRPDPADPGLLGCRQRVPAGVATVVSAVLIPRPFPDFFAPMPTPGMRISSDNFF